MFWDFLCRILHNVLKQEVPAYFLGVQFEKNWSYNWKDSASPNPQILLITMYCGTPLFLSWSWSADAPVTFCCFPPAINFQDNIPDISRVGAFTEPPSLLWCVHTEAVLPQGKSWVPGLVYSVGQAVSHQGLHRPNDLPCREQGEGDGLTQMCPQALSATGDPACRSWCVCLPSYQGCLQLGAAPHLHVLEMSCEYGQTCCEDKNMEADRNKRWLGERREAEREMEMQRATGVLKCWRDCWHGGQRPFSWVGTTTSSFSLWDAICWCSDARKCFWHTHACTVRCHGGPSADIPFSLCLSVAVCMLPLAWF